MLLVSITRVLTEPVHNLTHANNIFRLRVQVGVSYGSDVDLVKKVLLEAAHEPPQVIREPNPSAERICPVCALRWFRRVVP
jgi:small-conductance mechanosensitive channel